jgi:hypothetical protein
VSTWLFWTLFLGFGGGITLYSWRSNAKRDALEDAERKRRDDAESAFWKNAKTMRAKVLMSVQVGMVNLKPNFMLRLKIEAPDGPYEVEIEDHVDYNEVGNLKEGREIAVYVDAKDRNHVRVGDAEMLKILDDSATD